MPCAAKCAAMAVRVYNEAIYRETGIENIACINDVVAGKGYYIALQPTDNATPFAFAFGYNPDIAEALK